MIKGLNAARLVLNRMQSTNFEFRVQRFLRLVCWVFVRSAGIVNYEMHEVLSFVAFSRFG